MHRALHTKAHLIVVIATFAALSASPATRAQPVDSKLFKRVSACKSTGNLSPAPIVIVKLWHPAPSLNTKTAAPAKAPPQAQNFEEVEKQLGQWIKKKGIKTVIAEGCEGKFDDTTTFYGWTLADVKAKAKTPQFEKIVTHPALKLEAKYGDKVETWCGDLKQAINEELLAFSDARAANGYASRIHETTGNPAKQKIYLDGAIEAYKFPADTKAPQALELLKKELKKEIERIRTLNLKRSESLAQTAIVVRDEPTVILSGGTHASQIAKYLEEKRRDCVIYEPVHYSQDEETLTQALDELLK